jgi:hypothetical protein
MQVSDRQPAEVREILETPDRAELRRAAHKIAWTRMNGSIDAANPFMEADRNSFAPRDRGHDDRPSRHR